ncbi:MAG: hypothetical protein HY815_23390 [Candidatus Riflebacteria bacterium]|nr:hypothetical protein [Candidatus Riflebacteria bacterium]
MTIFGITGRNCAGKDSVADVLERRGYERHSLSDALRMELGERGATITRSALIEIGRELRESEGPAVLANRMKRLIRTHHRELARRREAPAPSFEEFLALEAREDSSDPNGQQLAATIAMADRTVVNDGTPADLEVKIVQLLREMDAVAAGPEDGAVRPPSRS